ncbi:MAG: peroxiredoxin [Roseibacillus sp.]|nr:peroxiredoxin [Roseibacillus sp.]
MSTLVGKTAPDFTTQAVMGNGEVVEDYNFSSSIAGKYAVLFFYPMDFTFVCPTELISLNNRIDTFRELGVEVVGVSIDSHWTHNAWRNTDVDSGGIGQVDYTLAADLSHAICQSYGIESDGGESYYPAGVAMRATFIIDQKGIIRSMTVNDEPLGRNMDEVIRTIEGLQFFEENGQVCPAGWNKAKAAFTPADPSKLADYLSENAKGL